jgi:hypothetical protein
MLGRCQRMESVIAALRLMRCVIVALAGAHLPKDLTTTLMYGLDKNIQLHRDDGLCLLEHEHEQGRSGNVIAVKEAGHWLYKQHAEV